MFVCVYVCVCVYVVLRWCSRRYAFHTAILAAGSYSVSSSKLDVLATDVLSVDDVCLVVSLTDVAEVPPIPTHTHSHTHSHTHTHTKA